MVYVSIIVAQLIIAFIVSSIQKAGIPGNKKKLGAAIFGLNFMLVPPMLAIAETQNLGDIHPASAGGCLLFIIIGFIVFYKALSTARKPS